MFDELEKYESEEFYKDHSIVKFITKEEEAQYEIISVFKSKVYYKDEKNVFKYYNFVNAKSELEFNEFIKNVKKASLYDTGKSATIKDKLMTLSTCDYSQKDGRMVIVAKKIN